MKKKKVSNVRKELDQQPQRIFRQISNSTRLPKTAFVLYLNEQKDLYDFTQPEASFKEFQATSLARWQALPGPEKTVIAPFLLLFSNLTLSLALAPERSSITERVFLSGPRAHEWSLRGLRTHRRRKEISSKFQISFSNFCPGSYLSLSLCLSFPHLNLARP
jgi:hypothetical protein